MKILSTLCLSSLLLFTACSVEEDKTNDTSNRTKTTIEYLNNKTKFVIKTVVDNDPSSGITTVSHGIKGDDNNSFILSDTIIGFKGTMTISCSKEQLTGSYIEYSCLSQNSESYVPDRNTTIQLKDTTTYSVYREENSDHTNSIKISTISR